MSTKLNRSKPSQLLVSPVTFVTIRIVVMAAAKKANPEARCTNTSTVLTESISGNHQPMRFSPCSVLGFLNIAFPSLLREGGEPPSRLLIRRPRAVVQSAQWQEQ